MLINKDRTKSLVKSSAWKSRKANYDTNSGFFKDLLRLTSATRNHLTSSEIEKVGNWMLYHQLWMENEESSLTISNTYNYVRGDIILSIDLGTSNIGTEIRYPHPCVVLYDNGEDWVVVAPITAASINKESGKAEAVPPFEVFIKEQSKRPKDKDEFFFRKDSVIQVDQITRISKHRAINKTRLKLRTDLLNQVDNIILEKYIPKKHQLVEGLKTTINDLKESIEERESELELMRVQYADSLTIINELQNKVKLLELQTVSSDSEKNIG